MKDLKTVVIFTMKEMVKRKSFVISTIIILLLIIIGFNIPNIINTFVKDGTEGNDDKILIVDNSNLFEGSLESLNQMNLGNEFEISNENISFDDIKSKIEDNEIKKAIIIEKEEGKYKLRYIVKNITSSMSTSAMPKELINSISTIYTNLQISKLGLTRRTNF